MDEKEYKYKQARLMMLSIRYLWFIGNSYIKTVLNLKETQIDNLCSIELLSSQAVEILLKSYYSSEICFSNKEKDEECLKLIIDKKLRDLSHNLKTLLDYDIDLKNQLNILSVQRVSNGFVDDYRLTMKNNSEISFKNLESVRYGVFASKQNIINGAFTNEMFLFLENLSRISHEKIVEVINKLK